MLELHIDSKDVSSGSVKVGWCVSKETLTKLAKEGIKDPQLILVLSPAGEAYQERKEVRKVVPLKDFFTYLEFRFSGPHNIWGFVGSQHSHKATKNFWLERAREGYERSMLSPSGDNSEGSYTRMKEGDYYWIVDKTEGPLAIDIPAEAFAAEPSPAIQKWVNHLFSRSPENQCDFRRRFLLSMTVQPVLFLLDLIPKTFLTLIAFLTGQRNFSLRHLFNPFTHFFRLFEDEAETDLFHGGTVFIGKGESTFSNWARLPLMPMIWLPLAIVGSLLYAHGYLLHTLSMIGVILVLLAVVVSMVVASAILLEGYRMRLEKQQPWYLNQDEMDLIVCSAGMNKPYSLGELPKQHRSIRLYFAVAKNAICRPFQG